MDNFNAVTALNFWQVFPIMVLVLTGCLVMLLDAFRMRSLLPWVTGAGILISMVVGLPFVSSMLNIHLGGGTGNERYAFFGMIRTDGIAGLIHIFLCVSGLFTLFFVNDYLGRLSRKVPDVFSLILFALVGMDLLANSNNLIITFIGLETMSIPLYVMAAAFKTESSSNESGLKYFLLGAFATGFFLYGIALIYGGTGTMRFDGIAYKWQALVDSGLLLPGFGLMLIGFLFKVSAFPFHMWTPDVYSGAPTPLAGFMATGSKAAAFIALGSFLRPIVDPTSMSVPVFGMGTEKIIYVVLGCALLSMIYGNVVAAQQKNMKRMLAYSSIAHSGYILLAICSGDEGFKAMLFYTFIYTLTNIGAFGMVGMAESRGMENNDMDSWKGIGMQRPWFGVLMSVFLFSMAGIPPLAGFFGKYFVFLTAIKRGWTEVAIVGIITSVVGAFYYIRVIVSMFFQKGEGKLDISRSAGPMVGAAVLVVLVLVLGLGSEPILTYIRTLFAIGTQSLALGE